MTDLSLLAYNEEPGPLAREVAENPQESIRCSSTWSSVGPAASAGSGDAHGAGAAAVSTASSTSGRSEWCTMWPEPGDIMTRRPVASSLAASCAREG